MNKKNYVARVIFCCLFCLIYYSFNKILTDDKTDDNYHWIKIETKHPKKKKILFWSSVKKDFHIIITANITTLKQSIAIISTFYQQRKSCIKNTFHKYLKTSFPYFNPFDRRFLFSYKK